VIRLSPSVRPIHAPHFPEIPNRAFREIYNNNNLIFVPVETNGDGAVSDPDKPRSFRAETTASLVVHPAQHLTSTPWKKLNGRHI
jgi:hypothetical protein